MVLGVVTEKATRKTKASTNKSYTWLFLLSLNQKTLTEVLFLTS